MRGSLADSCVTMLTMRALLVSTYELGRQPFGLASPAAWLRRDGVDVHCVDLAKEKLADDAIASGRSHRVPSADAHGDAPRRAGHREGARASTRRRVSARTASTRRSTPTGCARSASTMCSAASSKETWPRSRERSLRHAVRRAGPRRVRTARPAGARRALRFRACSSWCPIARACRRSRRYATLQLGDGRGAVGRLHRSQPRLPASVPPLPGRAGLQRAVPHRAAGRRAGGHRRAGGRRRRAHHVRRSGFLQRPDARDAHRRSAARRASDGDLRRHDQDRASAAASRSAAAVCATPAACS